MAQTVTIQINHLYQPNSNPYEPDVEAGLNALKAAGLVERGWDNTGNPGIIRHETGPEIIALATALVTLAASILDLVRASRRHHPETTVNVTVSNPEDLRKVLDVLGSS